MSKKLIIKMATVSHYKLNNCQLLWNTLKKYQINMVLSVSEWSTLLCFIYYLHTLYYPDLGLDSLHGSDCHTGGCPSSEQPAWKQWVSPPPCPATSTRSAPSTPATGRV